MRYLVIGSLIFILLLIASLSMASAEQIQVYPLQALFVSEKVNENALFNKAISSDNKGTDRNYAIRRFTEIFNKNFPNSAATINGQNRYSTFAVFLQIPRVSQYKIVKTDTLVDVYLPMTMTISFANMGTGEILYTYTYTYYSKREATFASLSDDNVTIGLYRDTFNSLLEKVVMTAKENFQPFSLSAVIKKDWEGLYILDKGDSQGITKGDNLIGPQGLPLNIIYAANHYSVAQPILGEPKVGMGFTKLSNGNLDEMKKPKVMLMPGTILKNGSGFPEQMLYQLFINALGKNAAFSLISIDKGFYDVQKVVNRVTGLTQAVTQQRELPDFFLRLQFNGPVSATLSSNKRDVNYDEHSVRACGDFLDRSGRVLYGKCVDEKITDEIVNGIRFSREDREEVVIKNAIIKLADDFIKAVKFKRFELSVQTGVGDKLTLPDKAGLLSIGSNEQVFRNIGRVDGIEGDVHVPTWLLSVIGRNTVNVDAKVLGPVINDMPKPSNNDKVLVEGMVTSVKDSLKRFTLCDIAQKEPINSLANQVYYSIVEGLGYPLYDSSTFNQALVPLMGSAYGFKAIDKQPVIATNLGFCVEPILKMTLDNIEKKDGYSSHKYKLVAGLKVYQNKDVAWKKGMQQSVSITCPDGAGDEYVNFELTKAICNLITDLSKQVEILQKN